MSTMPLLVYKEGAFLHLKKGGRLCHREIFKVNPIFKGKSAWFDFDP